MNIWPTVFPWCTSSPYPKPDESRTNYHTVFLISIPILPSTSRSSELPRPVNFIPFHSCYIHCQLLYLTLSSTKHLKNRNNYEARYAVLPDILLLPLSWVRLLYRQFVFKPHHSLCSSFCVTQQIQQSYAKGKLELCNRPFEEKQLVDCSARESRGQ
jgi:hypothetical protein